MPAAHFRLDMMQKQNPTNNNKITTTNFSFIFFLSALNLNCIEYLCRAHRPVAYRPNEKEKIILYNIEQLKRTSTADKRNHENKPKYRVKKEDGSNKSISEKNLPACTVRII